MRDLLQSSMILDHLIRRRLLLRWVSGRQVLLCWTPLSSNICQEELGTQVISFVNIFVSYSLRLLTRTSFYREVRASPSRTQAQSGSLCQGAGEQGGDRGEGWVWGRQGRDRGLDGRGTAPLAVQRGQGAVGRGQCCSYLEKDFIWAIAKAVYKIWKGTNWFYLMLQMKKIKVTYPKKSFDFWIIHKLRQEGIDKWTNTLR